MKTLRHERLAILAPADVVLARQKVREWALNLKFTLVDQTKLVTATSELARNTLNYGGGGQMTIEAIENATRMGLRLTFQDSGPGIPDIEAALKDGFTTGTGMGLGLGGSKRLVNEFEIESEAGKGTRVMVTRWK